ncbi:DUF2975 domain-containing protein [Microbacter margulisiae]|uniref:DUF2975 domain-containing protein n=1 Tax=Microbacter margulisiae TaxID=1350067 RepID=A0A7W5DS36_9PORP|nr:DUF2975 domain-containing protein [Microbacter margulisiae]MBB3187891.1 hypothetical protein [Microbacter margulisiae]
MKKPDGKRRLALLAILVGIVYLFLIGMNVLDVFNKSRQSIRYLSSQDQCSKSSHDGKSTSDYFISVMPTYNTQFQDSIINLKSERKIAVAFFPIHTIWLRASNDKPMPLLVKVFNIIGGLSLLIAIVLLIYIPILFYKLLYAIVKGNIFAKGIVQQIRKLALLLLVMYALGLLWRLSLFEINTILFQFANYRIVFANPNMIWLLLGVLALLIAEVIARGADLEEEQELTI